MARTAAALALSLFAALAPAGAGEAQQTFIALDNVPAIGVQRYLGVVSSRWIEGTNKYITVPDVTQRLVVVFSEGATEHAKGISHLLIEREAACPANTLARAAFIAYAADGAILERATALPESALRLLDHRYIEERWRKLCVPPMPPSPWPRPPMMLRVMDRPPHLGHEMAGAVASARALESSIAAAIALPEQGKFVIGEKVPERSLTLVDHATASHDGGRQLISWVMVGKPELPDDRAYLRARYDVDCHTKTVHANLIAAFDGDGRLVSVFENDDAKQAYDFLPWQSVRETIAAACVSDGPGLFDRTYKTFTAALAAARAN